MRTCPNCNEPVGDDPFCPNCGCRLPEAAAATAGSGAAPDPAPAPDPGPVPDPFAPQPGPSAAGKPPKPPKAPKTGGGINVKLIAVCAAAVVAAVLLAVLLWPRSAVAKFEDLQRGRFIDPAVELVAKTVSGARSGKLKTDLTLTADCGDRTLSRFLDDSSLVLKLDLDKGSLIANAAVSFMGSEILTGALTFDDGILGIQLPEADDRYYTMDAAVLMSLVTNTDPGGLELPELSAKDLRKIADSYLDEVFKTVTRNNLTVEKDETLKYAALRGRFDGTVYTFKPGAADIEDLVERIADKLEADRDICALIASFSRAAGKDMTEDGAKGMLEDAADTLRDNARDLGRSVKAAGFEWVLAVDGKTIRSLTITAGDEAYGLETDGDLKRGMDLAVYYEDFDRGRVDTLLEGSVRLDGKELEADISSENAFSLDIDVDLGKTSPLGLPYGDYSLSYWNGTYSIDMEVEDAKGGADHIITLGGDALDEELDGLELTLHASDKGTAKKPKEKPTDISDYTPGELSDLIEELGESIGRGLMEEMGLY